MTPEARAGLQRAFPYSQSSHQATTVLTQRLCEEIEASGPISFQNFMARALYDEQDGYYVNLDRRPISRHGDFITSVSVGPTFGLLLSERISRLHESLGSPEDFAIVEIGAHDGTLARDIRAAGQTHPYHIIEPLEKPRGLLEENLTDLPNVHIHAAPEKVAQTGILIANEVLDALPVPLLIFSQGAWQLAGVGIADNLKEKDGPALDFCLMPDLPADLKQLTADLGTDYPDGYVTEGPPALESFLKPHLDLFDEGLFLFIDYGLDQDSLYHPGRTVGTLRCYRQQSQKTHPLDLVGQQDLTADVNFTAVEKVARQLGLTPNPVMNQSRYLTHCAKKWLLQQPGPSPDQIRQFQTLIHPSQFGNRFYALELEKQQS